MTKTLIQAEYLALHDALGTRKDAEDKELFDQQHTQIWADCDVELQVRKAELEAKTILTPEEETELAELLAMFPTPPPPDPDLIRYKEILSLSPPAISITEIWEVLRIFGKKLGYDIEE